MTREKNSDKFSIDVTCPSDVKLFEVKAVVDDATWMQGANHHIDVSNRLTFDMYPWFNSKKGATSIIKNVKSKELNNSRDVIFYTPPSYFENTLKRYNKVLVMHDGQNLFDRNTAYGGNAWMCQDTR